MDTPGVDPSKLRDDSSAMIAVNAVLPTLATIAVMLRVLARRKKGTNIGADDYLIFVALVLAVGISMAGIYSAATGIIGKSLALMTPSRYQDFEKFLFADVIVCHAAYGFIKLSVLAFYKRIFVGKTFALAVYIASATVVVWTFGGFVAQLCSSHPVSAFWDHSEATEKTSNVYNYPTFLLAMCALDITMDLAILSFPLPVIKRLHMTSKRKWQVSSVFMLGIFCVVSSGVRMYYVYLNLFRFDGTIDDRSYYSDMSSIWANIEASASIITACLPMMGPLVSDNMGGMLSLKSLRDLFSLRSKASRNDVDEINLSDRGATWKAFATKVERQATPRTDSQDSEAEISLAKRPGAIVVDRSFGTVAEPQAHVELHQVSA